LNSTSQDEFNPDGIPNIWVAFSALRAMAEDIENAHDKGTFLDLKATAEHIESIGQMDEPIALLIEAALDHTLTPSNERLLRYLISVE